MSAYLYDEALTDKFKNWTKNSQVEIYGPNEVGRLFEVYADNNEDKPIELPIITLSRDRGYTIINSGTTRRPLSYDGITVNVVGTKADHITAIPIGISYQVDVFAKFAKEADVIARNLVFNIVNYPAMEIEVPGAKIWNEDTEEYEPYKHTARIEFASTEVQDNSNVQERFIEGNFTRLSLLITIQDAYLWDTREIRVPDIEIRLDDTYESYPDK